MYRISVDIGGTFTDMVVVDSQGRIDVFKAQSTTDSLSVAVMECINKAAQKRGMGLEEFIREVDTIIHGTTATTNALLTRTGAKTGVITTEGFRDIIELRRGMRIGLTPYNLKVAFPEPLSPRYLRLPVRERIRSDGEIFTPLNDNDVIEAIEKMKKEKVEAIAVCFLFSYINPEHELRAAEIIKKNFPECYVTISSEVLPYAREFERFNTTVVGAYVGPAFSFYINHLDRDLRNSGFEGNLLLIQSNGGIQDKEMAIKNPITTLLSGPAAGPSAAVFYAESLGENIISVDMGGTSFDAALIRNKDLLLTDNTWISEQRVASKLVDVHTIGAGGGSIAWFDSFGMLRVGPESAGADPGPTCYGKGGEYPTVTDADVLLGYISPDYFLGGEIKLDVESSKKVIGKVADRLGLDAVEAAYAIYEVVNENMADGLNEICTKGGYDPREFAMVAAGGAGPVHAANIARKARISRVLIPKLASIYCSFGMQLADYSHDYVRSYPSKAKTIDLDKVNQLFMEMEDQAFATLESEGIKREEIRLIRSIDMRYVGQYHEVGVELPYENLSHENLESILEAFHKKHDDLFSFSMPGREIELLYFRVQAIGKTKKMNLKKIETGGKDPKAALKGTRNCFFGDGKGLSEVPVYDGDMLLAGNFIEGPAIVEEKTTTVVTPFNFNCEVDAYGNYFLQEL